MTSREEKKKLKKRKREEKRDQGKSDKNKRSVLAHFGRTRDGSEAVCWFIQMSAIRNGKPHEAAFVNGLGKVIVFSNVKTGREVVRVLLDDMARCIKARRVWQSHIDGMPLPVLIAVNQANWSRIQQENAGGHIMCDSMDDWQKQKVTLRSRLRLEQLRRS